MRPGDAMRMEGADEPVSATVIAARLGISVKTLYAYVAAGRFPKPLRIGPRCVRWPASVVADFMAASS